METKIRLKNIQLFGWHGVADKEKKIGQQFEIDIEAEAQLKSAIQSDDIRQTVDYSKLYETVVDIFDLSQHFHQDFDVVLEYTCFCAIDPTRRKDYIEMVSHILKPEGELVGLLFPIDKDPKDDGPPFGVDLNATILLFSRYMNLIKKEIPKLSIERRKGREIFIIFRKDGN